MADAGSEGAVNPWLSVWRRPRATILGLAGRQDRRGIILLSTVAGVALLLGALRLPYLHWLATLAAGVVLGPLVGLLQLWISGALGAWSGRLLGGQATAAGLRLAFAWSWLPHVASVAVLIAVLLVFRQGASAPSVDDGVALVAALISLLSFVLAVRMIGAIQGFGVVRAILNTIAPSVVAGLLALAFRTFLYQPFSIPAGSMLPTLLIGDFVYVDKLAYGLSRYSFPFGPDFEGRIWPGEPKRGDVVVFAAPDGSGTAYVKRIVGLAGDTVEMKRGTLAINGEDVASASVGSFETIRDGLSESAPAFTETLPGGFSHTVLDSEIDGPLDTAGPFTVPAGHFFVLGDHRDNSVDSRSREMGFVPFDNLIGRVSIIYFSAGEVALGAPASAAFDNIRWSRIGLCPG